MIDYSYLRPKKAEALRKWHESGFHKRTTLECSCYKDAIILPVKKDSGCNLQFGKGGVIDTRGGYIAQSGIEGRVGGVYEHATAAKCDEKVVYCGYWVKQWGHFLVEGVARLWYFLENDPTVDKYIFVSEENGPTELYGNYFEFFRLLGLIDKVEIINQPIQYREVIVPELGYSRKYYYSDCYKQIFDIVSANAEAQCVREHSESMPARVFLSRSQLPKARDAEVGLDFLDHYFEKNGYVILYPEKMSLAEMIHYLQNAEICAAESGTLPHNFLFAQREKSVVIVERQVTVNEIQANLDIVCGLNVTYIDGHYSMYPVSAGWGPYVFGYTDCFDSFGKTNGYLLPDEKYCSESYFRKAIKKYLAIYRRAYGYSCGMDEWQMMYAEAMYEAYQDSMSVFGKYLCRERAFSFAQLGEVHFIKLILKRILRRK